MPEIVANDNSRFEVGGLFCQRNSVSYGAHKIPVAVEESSEADLDGKNKIHIDKTETGARSKA